MIRPEDEYFHERTDDPYWNESAWFSFSVPERAITGAVYFYHRPNMNFTVGGVLVFDPSGANERDCLYYELGDLYPFEKSFEMYDFALDNGLTAQCVKPLRTYRLTYRGAPGWHRGPGCELDLTWDAIAEPVDTGFPETQQEWGKGHYQQPGRVRGTLSVAGEQFAVDCWTMRDHSWGPRRPTAHPRAQFPWAVASESRAFHLYAIQDLPPEHDPVIGADDRVVGGWYLDDGEVSALRKGLFSVVERAEQGHPTRVKLVAEDELGRPVRAEGPTTNLLNWRHHPTIWTWWQQVDWDLNGMPALGETNDYWPLQHVRRFLRSPR